jgi:phosphoribosylformylglycinamidine synthase
MGGSEYLALKGQLGVNVPKVNPQNACVLYTALSHAIHRGLVASCHDCSDGGLGVALAESAFAGGYGMDLDISAIPVDSAVIALFSESQSRFVATVAPENAAAFNAAMGNSPVLRIGEVIPEKQFKLKAHWGAAINVRLADLKEAWQRPLRW